MIGLTLFVPCAPITSSSVPTLNGGFVIPSAAQSVSKVFIVNESPAARGGATIYDMEDRHSIQLWGGSLPDSGQTVDYGSSFEMPGLTGDSPTIGIQWNVYRIAPNGDTCDNACRQVYLDVVNCATTLKTDGLCFSGTTPTWSPDLQTELQDGVCTIKVAESSTIDHNPDGTEPEACSCISGAAPCNCGSSPDNVCAGVCPADSTSACGGSAGDCQYCPGTSLGAPMASTSSSLGATMASTKKSLDTPMASTSSIKVTVKNNCGSETTVVLGQLGSKVAQSCQDDDCGTLVSDALSKGFNPSLYIGPAPFYPYKNNNYGAATLAEFNHDGNGQFWVDISRVEGFNYGVSIADDDDKWRLTCRDVNCNDAYWLCDDASGNPLFSPNSNKTTTAFKVTFCPPESEENTNLYAKDNKCLAQGYPANPREQDPRSSSPYICNTFGVARDLHGGTCVTGKVSADGKCVDATPSGVHSCGD